MKKGGYQIIDLKNLAYSASNSTYTIAGTYDKIEGTTKPTRISGLNWNGNYYHDTFVDFDVVSGGVLEATVYGLTISVSDDDNVVIEPVTVGG